jgi:glutaminase
MMKSRPCFVEVVRRLTGAADVDYELRVALSEWQHTERNLAMALCVVARA